MTFDEITGDGRLWAVRYDGENDNELYNLFDKWNNVLWLRDKTHGYNAGMHTYCTRIDKNRASPSFPD